MGSSALKIYERKITSVGTSFLFPKVISGPRKRTDIIATCYRPDNERTSRNTYRLEDGEWKQVIRSEGELGFCNEEGGKRYEELYAGSNARFVESGLVECCHTVEYATREETMKRPELQDEIRKYLRGGHKLWDY